jgi:hypothetical protein
MAIFGDWEHDQRHALAPYLRAKYVYDTDNGGKKQIQKQFF